MNLRVTTEVVQIPEVGVNGRQNTNGVRSVLSISGEFREYLIERYGSIKKANQYLVTYRNWYKIVEDTEYFRCHTDAPHRGAKVKHCGEWKVRSEMCTDNSHVLGVKNICKESQAEAESLTEKAKREALDYTTRLSRAVATGNTALIASIVNEMKQR